MPQRLFVYGTLGPGRPNEQALNAIGGTWEEASVNGYKSRKVVVRSHILASEVWGQHRRATYAPIGQQRMCGTLTEC